MFVSECIEDLKMKVQTAKNDLRKMKQAQQKEKRDQAAAARRKREHLDVAATIMTLQDGRLEAALCYCTKKSIDVVEAQNWLEGCLLHAPLEELVTRLHCGAARNKRLVACARVFLREWDLAAWVRGCNDEEGLAPLYENVFSHKVGHCHTNEPNVRQPRATSRSSKIQWVRRFKRRWNGAFGTVKKQNGLSEADLRKQAVVITFFAFFSLSATVFWYTFLARKTGLFFGPLNMLVYRT